MKKNYPICGKPNTVESPHYFILFGVSINWTMMMIQVELHVQHTLRTYVMKRYGMLADAVDSLKYKIINRCTLHWVI